MLCKRIVVYLVAPMMIHLHFERKEITMKMIKLMRHISFRNCFEEVAAENVCLHEGMEQKSSVAN